MLQASSSEPPPLLQRMPFIFRSSLRALTSLSQLRCDKKKIVKKNLPLRADSTQPFNNKHVIVVAEKTPELWPNDSLIGHHRNTGTETERF